MQRCRKRVGVLVSAYTDVRDKTDTKERGWAYIYKISDIAVLGAKAGHSRPVEDEGGYHRRKELGGAAAPLVGAHGELFRSMLRGRALAGGHD